MPPSCRLFTVATDICIVNTELYLARNLLENHVTFVDISMAAAAPVIIDISNHKSIPTMLTEVSGCVSAAVAMDPKLHSEMSDRFCGPTLLGLLAGYPIVYWYDQDNGDDNCLSNCPLRVFQLVQSTDDDNVEHIIYSISCPVSVLVGNSLLNRTANNWFRSLADRFRLQFKVMDRTMNTVNL